MFSVDKLQKGLNTKFIGQKIEYKQLTHSTNDDAWAYFQNNQMDGIVIVSEKQQKGRGRRQSKWSSSPGNSLTFSFLLFPEISIEEIGILPLLTGISIVQGIYNSTKIQVGLKWPNDIFLNEKKIGGILIESKTTESDLGVVVGVGLNINESLADIPFELQNQATSLSLYTGKKYHREPILSLILNIFENLYFHHWDKIIPLWENYCIHENKVVKFHSNNKNYRGKFLGITEGGFAQIEVDGNIEIFPAGMLTI